MRNAATKRSAPNTTGAGRLIFRGRPLKAKQSCCRNLLWLEHSNVCISELAHGREALRLHHGVVLNSIEAILKQPQRGCKLNYLHNYRTAQTKKKSVFSH